MSDLEDTLFFQMRLMELPMPEREYRFCPGRKFRADFAFVGFKLLIEVDGATWTNGRHSRGAGIASDCEKQNLAVLLGYRVLRFTGDMVMDGTAIKTISEAMK